MNSKIRFYHSETPSKIKIKKIFFDRKAVDNIYDIDGKCIFKSNIINNLSFNIPFSNGYMHDISLGGGIISHGTIISYINKEIK